MTETRTRHRINRVWLLNIGIGSVAALLAYLAADTPALEAPLTVPWPIIAIAFYAAELTVVHLRFRRDAHSFSMSEVPVVVGLFFVSPLALITAQLVGNTLALAVNRRQPPVKLAFNVAQFSLQTVISIHVFRWFVDLGNPQGPAGWIGTGAATLTATVVATILITTAIRLSGGRLDRQEFIEVLSLSALAAAMNAALGLVGVTIMWTSPATAWMALAPPVILFLAYRAYVSQRHERARLESLYEATRVLHESPQIEEALLAAADHARGMFEAEFVEITVFPEGLHGTAYRTTTGPDEFSEVMHPVDSAMNRELWNLVNVTGHAVILSSDSKLTINSDYPINEAIVAPLPSANTMIGVVLVANRLGDTSRFDAGDLKLLDTLANAVSVSLENGQLEDSLAQLTELKEELRHQALHDSLTGLANRVLFADMITHGLRRCDPQHGFAAVLFLDLDDFKTVNDSLGHAAGDQLLISVADRLHQTTRLSDTVARLGGDEFAVLLEGLSAPSDAADIAEKIIDQLATPINLQGKEITPTASVGIAYGRHGDSADQVLRNADAAMYAAKRRRKGTFEVFQSTMHAEIIERLELRADLKDAVARGQMELEYQPIVNLKNGHVSGFEALLRWNHPDRGLVEPTQFVGFAEETGLIVPLGRWVMEEAIRQARIWQDRHPGITVAVNLSPRQLVDTDLVAETSELLARYGLAPERLIVEITENVLMNTSVRALEELRELGVGLAIDDFGTGYSSLSYLDRLPIDIMKVDRSFVQRLEGGKGESPLVRTVLQLGQALDIDTVVEGIETADQLARVTELGCGEGQGFYFSQPLAAADIESFLARTSNGRLIAARPKGDTGEGHLRIVG